jgi:hypothetical protein
MREKKILADAEAATKLCQRPCGHYHGEPPARSLGDTPGAGTIADIEEQGFVSRS